MTISKLNFRGLDLKKDYDKKSLESVILRAHTGNTLLFVGAGFSLGSQNTKGTALPLAREISRKICELGGFEVDEDLAFSADYFLEYNEPGALIELLKNSFTCTEVSTFHRKIAGIDWRRVYTTNYDNCYELASAQMGKSILPITLEQSPAKYFRSRDICVHINGAIQLLDNESLERSFKLTESSYTNSDAFSDSSWSYRFKKDLEICTQVIFVGYSLYDMEVKRLLVGGDNIMKKTYFITGEDVSQKEYHRLSAFGEVFPIGVEKFGNFLAESTPEQLPEPIGYLASLQKEEISFDAEYSDSDIRDFLLRGKANPNFILSSLTRNRQPYAVEREYIRKSLEILDSTNIIVIHSSLANGKSVLARQIVSHLLIDGKHVYTLRDEESDYEKDIETLTELNQRVYLLIDDFEKNLDIVRYFSNSLGSNGKLILTERPHRHRRAAKTLAEYGLNSYNMNVDYLHDNEVNDLANMLTNTGLWGDLGGVSNESQIRYLSDECESQLSIILMKLLKAPHVLDLFRSAFSEILRFPETKKTVHAICLIQHIYPSACRTSLISSIADSNHIYSKEFEDRVTESGLFEFRGDKLTTRSSVFGTFILNSLYNASYSIDQMVRVLKKLEKNYSTQSFEERELNRSMMTFSTLSAILPDKDRVSSYIQFYERLKLEVPYVVNNPHYWLQYGMALISGNNLSDAERILNMAYAKADNQQGYDTTYIDNQFARLNLKKALSETEQSLSIDYFMKAHEILRKEDNDIYKFRQAGLYLPYYKERYVYLSKGNRVKFEHAIKEMSAHFETYIESEYPLGAPTYQSDNLEEFKKVIDEILNDRKT